MEDHRRLNDARRLELVNLLLPNSLWVTELGWASRGRRSLGLVTDRSGQAHRLARSFARLLRQRDRLNLRGAFWFAWRDTEHGVPVCSWCPHAGLISRTSPTPWPARRSIESMSPVASQFGGNPMKRSM